MRAAIVLACAGMPATVNAQQAPYCDQFSDGTSPNCSFATLQQCNASISGVGGVCKLNPAASNQGLPPPARRPPPFNPMGVPPPPGALAPYRW
jgi:Protein of unknown function (DUF3551)